MPCRDHSLTLQIRVLISLLLHCCSGSVHQSLSLAMCRGLSRSRTSAAGTVCICLAVFAASVASIGCPKGCSEHGTCNEEMGRCDCPRNRTGLACEEHLDPQVLAKRCLQLGFKDISTCTNDDNINRCLSGCNSRGTCLAGFCHCEKGFFGADCGLSLAADGKPQVLAGRGYRPRSRGPRVYVYDLPPNMTTWRNDMRLDRPTLRLFQERLIATGVRVGDGDTADWYFIPIIMRHFCDASTLLAAVSYIRETHPWWNRTDGHRHFVIATGDMGRSESERGNLTANVTFVTYWGLTRTKPFGWRASHHNATDIVLPVFLGTPKLSRMGIFTSRLHPKFATKAPPELRERTGPIFFFAGRICGDHSKPRLDGVWPHCKTGDNKFYSAGTRQLVHFHHWNRTGYFVQVGDRHYAKHLLTSKYCFGPTGGGHGQRQMQAVQAGCVPVVISDYVLEAFEPFLDWNTFGVRLAEADIPRLHEVLEAISPQEYARKEVLLRCAAQHMAFSTVTGSYMGESGRYDAFETLLEILRAKAAHPSTPPEQLRQVDPQLDAFMDCRDPKDPELAAAAAAAAAAGGAGGTGGGGAGGTGGGGAGGGGDAGRLVDSKGEGAPPSSSLLDQQQHQQQQQQGQELLSTRGTDSDNDSSSRILSSSSSNTKERLCSVSLLDEDDPGAPSCKSLSARRVDTLFGGYMCIRKPLELVACPRPWP